MCISYRQFEAVVPLEDPIVTEVTSTLQEWAVLWKQLYVVSDNQTGFPSFLLAGAPLQLAAAAVAIALQRSNSNAAVLSLDRF